MGNNLSRELADGIDGVQISLKDAIAIQLRSNHYPPVPLSMVEPCISAIDACNADDSELLIALPDGVSWRGKESAPAWAIVESHHLEFWVSQDEY